MFFRPGFAHRSKNIVPNVHENPSQNIQGGLPGEHYHLSAALYSALIGLINNPIYSELVTSNSGELVTSNSGDTVTVFVNVTPGSSTGAAIDTSSPVITVPDVVTPPVQIPAPSPLHDPYWNQVVLAAIVAKPLGSNQPLVIGGIDIYHALTSGGVSWAGSTTGFGSNIPIPGYNQSFSDGSSTPLLGVGTIDPAAAFNDQVFMSGTTLQYGQAAKFPSDFTVEQMVAIRTGALGYLLIMLGTSVNSYGIEYDETISQLTTFTLRSGSRQNEDVLPISNPLARNTFHTIALSRTGMTVMLWLNGEKIKEITFASLPTLAANYVCSADIYGPVRITKGFGRYGPDMVSYDSTIPWIFN